MVKSVGCMKFLKQRLPLESFKMIEKLVKARRMISQEVTAVKFYEQCLQYNYFPYYFTKVLRKQKIRPTLQKLRQLTNSHIESKESKISELRRISSRYNVVVNDLNIVCRVKLVKFLQDMQLKVSRRHSESLLKSLIK
ncbi:unnamed protein product [Heterobilharzia americana]|nr:unnamed protein product [Heterobilharzia americana]